LTFSTVLSAAPKRVAPRSIPDDDDATHAPEASVVPPLPSAVVQFSVAAASPDNAPKVTKVAIARAFLLALDLLRLFVTSEAATYVPVVSFHTLLYDLFMLSSF
jgi:hypothetical protein